MCRVSFISVLAAILLSLACQQTVSAPLPDIEATVQARVRATIEALPTETMRPTATQITAVAVTPTQTATSTSTPMPTSTTWPTRTPTPTRTPVPTRTATPMPDIPPTATPFVPPTPDVRRGEYLDTAIEFRERESLLAQGLLDFEFPPEGVVTIEWAEGVEGLRDGFDELVSEWNQVEPAAGFERHHELFLSTVEAELRVASAMFSWIGVGAGREARQLRIEAHRLAVDELNSLMGLASSALDDALAAVEGGPGSATLRADPIIVAELSIDEISSRVTDQTEFRWQFAWRIRARNISQTAVEFAFSLRWLDKDQFIVDSTNEFGLILASGETRTFSGAEQINLPAAFNVTRIEIEVLQTRAVPP